jgi:uncharacterized protein (DUF305 family)
MNEVRTDEISTLPWRHSALNVVLALIVAAGLGIVAGYFAGNSSSQTAHNAVDTGFLQDMRIHHEQAVVMSTIYLGAAPQGNSTLRTIAREIMLEQQFDAGRMVQLLRMFQAAETNESDQVMGWMGTPIPLSRMPGYATDSELEKLYQSRDAQADDLFISLMIAHHKGGLHMAEYAVKNGKNKEVIAFASMVVESQSSEIGELTRLRAQ